MTRTAEKHFRISIKISREKLDHEVLHAALEREGFRRAHKNSGGIQFFDFRGDVCAEVIHGMVMRILVPLHKHCRIFVHELTRRPAVPRIRRMID